MSLTAEEAVREQSEFLLLAEQRFDIYIIGLFAFEQWTNFPLLLVYKKCLCPISYVQPFSILLNDRAARSSNSWSEFSKHTKWMYEYYDL